MSLVPPEKVQKLQQALHAKAKGSPDYRFYLLYDKLYREDILTFAYQSSRANGGAAGVDGQTFADIEAYGLERWLGELTQELRTKSYRPQAVRRVWIPKPDGKKRPLGIPTVKDRVVQMAAVLVLGLGRCQKVKFKDSDILINLIKNPTGATEVLKTIDLNSNILIAINDNYADGCDISWLWDAYFEYLSDVKNKIVCSGKRAFDVALRLKYAGVKEENLIIIGNIKDALNYMTNQKADITVLSSYTALLKIKRIIK